MCIGIEGRGLFQNRSLEIKGMHIATEAVQECWNDGISPCPVHSLKPVMMERPEDLLLECGDHQLRC